jgi:hypothetical protein
MLWTSRRTARAIGAGETGKLEGYLDLAPGWITVRTLGGSVSERRVDGLRFLNEAAPAQNLLDPLVQLLFRWDRSRGEGWSNRRLLRDARLSKQPQE